MAQQWKTQLNTNVSTGDVVVQNVSPEHHKGGGGGGGGVHMISGRNLNAWNAPRSTLASRNIMGRVNNCKKKILFGNIFQLI